MAAIILQDSIDKVKCCLCGAICETSNKTYNKDNTEILFDYECPNCGAYSIYGSCRLELSDDISIRMLSMMYYYILHKNRDNKKMIFCLEDITNFVDDNKGRFSNDGSISYIDKKTLESMYPKNINEKIDMIMMNLSTRIKYAGNNIDVTNTADISSSIRIYSLYDKSLIPEKPDKYIFFYAFFLVDDTISQKSDFGEQIQGAIDILKELNYLECTKEKFWSPNDITYVSNAYTFKAEGWKRVIELQSKNEELPQAFIAMWFDRKKTMDLARDKIKKAITDSGYLPVIIDEKEHNKQIVPEIFYEIKRSKFIIADLTGHRPGVYYEAGYAQALGKEVILSCKEKDFKKRHFDIAQINAIRWSDEKDLYEKLMKRIESTVGIRNS